MKLMKFLSPSDSDDDGSFLPAIVKFGPFFVSAEITPKHGH